jgi:nitrogen regulatory protein PII
MPTNVRRKPAASPDKHDRRGGLSLGATVGIAIGIALVMILGAVSAWVFIRRRRRTWAQKRREQGDPEARGETPNEEITKKIAEEEKGESVAKELRVDGVVELADGDAKTGTRGERPMSELHTDTKAYEMSTAPKAVEIGDGKVFVAELEGSDVRTQQVYKQAANKTAPTQVALGKKEEHSL